MTATTHPYHALPARRKNKLKIALQALGVTGLAVAAIVAGVLLAGGCVQKISTSVDQDSGQSNISGPEQATPAQVTSVSIVAESTDLPRNGSVNVTATPTITCGNAACPPSEIERLKPARYTVAGAGFLGDQNGFDAEIRGKATAAEAPLGAEVIVLANIGGVSSAPLTLKIVAAD